MLSCVKLKIGPQFQMCTDARQQPISGYESQMLFCIRTCVVAWLTIYMLLPISGYRTDVK